MKIQFYKQNGEKDKTVDYPFSLQSSVSSEKVLAYIKYLRNITRDPIANTKDRSEVRGGGKKPWRQKGTGRARHGSRRSPIWSGGGVTFGPSKNRNFSLKLNKKEKKAVILSVIGQLVKDKKVIGLSKLSLPEPKTKKATEILQKLPIEGRFSLILNSSDKNTEKSFRNLPSCVAIMSNKIDILKIMVSDMLVFTDLSYKNFLEIYNQKTKKIITKTGGTDAK